MSINSLSKKIAEYLSKKTGDNKEVLSYGLEIIIGATLKIALISILAIVLGVFPQTMTLLVFASTLRVVSGGAHCTSYRRCILSGLTIFLSLGFLSTKLNLILTSNLLIFYYCIIFIFIISVILIWVPGESENRQFSTKQSKVRFKLYSSLVLVICYIIVYFILQGNDQLIATAGLTGLLWQSFSITPLGYKFLGLLDKTLKLIQL